MIKPHPQLNNIEKISPEENGLKMFLKKIKKIRRKISLPDLFI